MTECKHNKLVKVNNVEIIYVCEKCHVKFSEGEAAIFNVLANLEHVDNKTVASYTQQIKSRLPLEIAGKVDCWPRALSAISQLKQERNNSDAEVMKLNTELKNTIKLTGAEIQSGLTRQRAAEGLILQLPKDHDGRNTWLLNYGIGKESQLFRDNHSSGIVKWNIKTNAAYTMSN